MKLHIHLKSTTRPPASLCIQIALFFLLTAVAKAQLPASTPPLGWNSWDSFGLSITAAEWKANVDWFHQHLQPAGWQYVVLDEGWYLAHPENANTKGADQGYTLNGYGQFTAAPNRFPKGIAALAADAHALGLHILLFRVDATDRPSPPPPGNPLTPATHFGV